MHVGCQTPTSGPEGAFNLEPAASDSKAWPSLLRAVQLLHSASAEARETWRRCSVASSTRCLAAQRGFLARSADVLSREQSPDAQIDSLLNLLEYRAEFRAAREELPEPLAPELHTLCERVETAQWLVLRTLKSPASS